MWRTLPLTLGGACKGWWRRSICSAHSHFFGVPISSSSSARTRLTLSAPSRTPYCNSVSFSSSTPGRLQSQARRQFSSTSPRPPTSLLYATADGETNSDFVETHTFPREEDDHVGGGLPHSSSDGRSETMPAGSDLTFTSPHAIYDPETPSHFFDELDVLPSGAPRPQTVPADGVEEQRPLEVLGARRTLSISLRERSEALAAEFHPTRNAPLSVDVPVNLAQPLWWQCQRDPSHVWLTRLVNRVRAWHRWQHMASVEPGRFVLQPPGCPHCPDSTLLRGAPWPGHTSTADVTGVGPDSITVLPVSSSQTRSVADYSPALAAEFHETKNAPLTPTKPVVQAQMLWWRCRRDRSHEWKTLLINRLKKLRAQRRAERRDEHSNKNSLAGVGVSSDTDSNSIRETIEGLAANERRRVHALVPGCPDCSLKFRLKQSRPKLLHEFSPAFPAEFHPTKNYPARVTDRFLKTDSVWWICKRYPSDEAHAHESTIQSRLNRHVVCRVCDTGKRLPISAISETLAREFHPTKNGKLKPTQYIPRNTRIWWQCPVHPQHVYSTELQSRVPPGVLARARSGDFSRALPEPRSGCPVCRKQRTAAEMLSDEVRAMWHPQRNGATTPADVRWGRGQTFWWRCVERGHEFEADMYFLAQRAADKRCPTCKVLPRSIARTHPLLAAEVESSPSIPQSASGILPSSKHLVWWRCHRCAHLWQESPLRRTRDRLRCPACLGGGGPQRGNIMERDRRVASQWDFARNLYLPHQVAYTDPFPVWWRCGAHPDVSYRASPRERLVGDSLPQRRRGRGFEHAARLKGDAEGGERTYYWSPSDSDSELLRRWASTSSQDANGVVPPLLSAPTSSEDANGSVPPLLGVVPDGEKWSLVSEARDVAEVEDPSATEHLPHVVGCPRCSREQRHSVAATSLASLSPEVVKCLVGGPVLEAQHAGRGRPRKVRERMDSDELSPGEASGEHLSPPNDKNDTEESLSPPEMAESMLNVGADNNQRFLWRCPVHVDDEPYAMSVYERLQKHGCPRCAKNPGRPRRAVASSLSESDR